MSKSARNCRVLPYCTGADPAVLPPSNYNDFFNKSETYTCVLRKEDTMTISRRESFKALTGSIAALAFASKMSAAKPLNAAASDASGAVCSSCGADLTKIEAMLSDSLGSAALAAWASRPTPLVATVRAGNGLPIGYVGSANGNLSFALGDLAVDSLPQIGIMRHYSSLNMTDSGLGLGWSIELDDVVEVSGGNAVLRTGGGETVPMVLGSSGDTFEPVNPALTHHRPLR